MNASPRNFAEVMAAHSKKSYKRKPADAPKFNKSSKKSFKAKKEQNDAVRSEAAVALQLEDDVPDFPRGFCAHLNGCF